MYDLLIDKLDVAFVGINPAIYSYCAVIICAHGPTRRVVQVKPTGCKMHW